MSLNRAVALLTPVFTAVAGLAAGFAAKYGFHLDPTQITTAEIAAATAGAGSALSWLKGHQQFERIQADIEAQARAIELHAQELGLKIPSESELVHAAEQKAEQAAAALAAAIEGRRAAESVAAASRAAALEAEHRLAQVQAALSPHVKADPNLVLPDQPEATPQSVTQPIVEPDVANSAPVEETQPAVLPTSPTIAEQTQLS